MTVKKTVNIGLVGYGVVGKGVGKLFEKDSALIDSKAGTHLNLSWICSKSAVKMPVIRGSKVRFTNNWQDVVDDPSVDIIIELIGGYEPARTLVLAALKAGKHVATANKALLAKYWGEVHEVAQASNALLYFEGSVGGGIPVVQGLSEGLSANRIEKIYGILNGTTNYILTRMAREGISFDKALKAAQKAGFAEADPSFDINGIDAAHKLAVLASLACGDWVHVDEVASEGISDLEVWDVRFAESFLKMTVKLLGIADFGDKNVSLRVHPTLIPLSHPFANVSQEYNAVIVHGDLAGDVMFYGKGAGQLPAASAVVSDVIYLARQVAAGLAGEIPYVVYKPTKLLRKPFKQLICRHYLRFNTVDKPGVLSRIAHELGRRHISIASVYQEEKMAGRGMGVPIVVVTHKAKEGDVQDALKYIGRLPFMRRKPVRLRIEDF